VAQPPRGCIARQSGYGGAALLCRCRSECYTRGVKIVKSALLAGCLMVAALVATNAPAAASPPPVPVTASAPSYSFAAAPSDGGASPNATYTCTLNVQRPHNSTHVGGTVNVVATISCGIAVTRMNLQVTLYKVVYDPGCSQVPYGKTGSSVTYGNRTIQANSAAACSSGDYFGQAYGSIQAPPGYTPPTGTVEGPGPTVAISC
jgi:hypothetical protein